MVSDMTDKQATRADLQARIDELTRLLDITTDPDTIQYARDRLREIRASLDNLNP